MLLKGEAAFWSWNLDILLTKAYVLVIQAYKKICIQHCATWMRFFPVTYNSTSSLNHDVVDDTVNVWDGWCHCLD